MLSHSYLVIGTRLDVKGPQQPRECHEEALFGQWLPAAHPSSPSECVVSLFVRVRPLESAQETLRAERVGRGVLAGVPVDGPDVAVNRGALRDKVSAILIVSDRRMWDATLLPVNHLLWVPE